MRSLVTWRRVAAVAVCCGGLVAVFVAFRNLGNRGVPVSIADDSGDPLPASPGLIVVAEAGAEQIARRTVDVVSDRASELAIRNADELAADAGAIMRAWLAGGAEEYFAYLEASGSEPPPAAWDTPGEWNEAWLDATEGLREASFDPGAAVIRTAYDAGQPRPDERELGRIWGSRFSKVSSLDADVPRQSTLLAAALDVKEVVIPMQVQGDGRDAKVNALMGLSYAWDDGRAEWLLVEVSFYGMPPGGAPRIPPF